MISNMLVDLVRARNSSPIINHLTRIFLTMELLLGNVTWNNKIIQHTEVIMMDGNYDKIENIVFLLSIPRL